MPWIRTVASAAGIAAVASEPDGGWPTPPAPPAEPTIRVDSAAAPGVSRSSAAALRSSAMTPSHQKPFGGTSGARIPADTSLGAWTFGRRDADHVADAS